MTVCIDKFILMIISVQSSYLSVASTKKNLAWRHQVSKYISWARGLQRQFRPSSQCVLITSQIELLKDLKPLVCHFLIFLKIMKFYLELITLLLISWYENSEAQTSIFDAFLPQLRMGKDMLLNAAMPTSENAKNLGLVAALQETQFNKLQPKLNDDVPFPCPLNNTRSKKRPKSVHMLRPGDIDVVGALGDSLTAGNGLAAINLWHVGVENRGISFSIGGQGTWRQFVTLPNILKEFNPRLIGYSLRDSFGHHAMAKFNAAEAGAMSRDMPYMAKVLIKRMKDDPSVNIRRDWKMISFMIGSNDFCAEMCYRRNPEDVVEEHRKDLLKTLRTLRENLPRTVVNLIVSPNLTALVNVTLSNRPSVCYFTHNFECPCLFGLQFKNLQNKFREIMLKWQRVEMEVANYAEFDREDFTVVAQPFTFEYKLHPTKEGLTDYSLFSRDCFHLSQKEAARAALSLWNNILEPVGSKSTHPSELFDFKCPTKEHPFILTRRNSLRNFKNTEPSNLQLKPNANVQQIGSKFTSGSTKSGLGVSQDWLEQLLREAINM